MSEEVRMDTITIGKIKVTVCIGSSCHIKGSRQVVEQLQYLIAQNDLLAVRHGHTGDGVVLTLDQQLKAA